MARPREFDEKTALDAAVQCFWHRGYEATATRDLASQMGISAASLYNAFGDKESLFRTALAHYVENNFGERSRRLEASLPPREALVGFFTEVIEISLADRQRKGCLLVNSALEVASHDKAFRQSISEVLMRVEAFFRRCIAAGQQAGTIGTSQSADDLARLCLGTLLGIRVLARTRPERALLEGLMRPIFALLDGSVSAEHGRSS